MRQLLKYLTESKLMTSMIWAIITLPLLVGLNSTATAGSVCGPHEKIVTQLETGYEEARSGFGLSGNGAMVELFVSKEKGTWTFMLTRPDGMTCLVATGANWENLSLIEKASEEIM